MIKMKFPVEICKLISEYVYTEFVLKDWVHPKFELPKVRPISDKYMLGWPGTTLKLYYEWHEYYDYDRKQKLIRKAEKLIEEGKVNEITKGMWKKLIDIPSAVHIVERYFDTEEIFPFELRRDFVTNPAAIPFIKRNNLHTWDFVCMNPGAVDIIREYQDETKIYWDNIFCNLELYDEVPNKDKVLELLKDISW
jgi:hypothetical protein